MDYEKWKQNYRIKEFTQRMGQAFCNEFIKGPWPELFYEENYFKADELITGWLIHMQYYPNTPEPLQP